MDALVALAIFVIVMILGMVGIAVYGSGSLDFSPKGGQCPRCGRHLHPDAKLSAHAAWVCPANPNNVW